MSSRRCVASCSNRCATAASSLPVTAHTSSHRRGTRWLNLAASGAVYLSRALTGYFRRADNNAIDAYPAAALAPTWKRQRFSRHLNRLMHRFPNSSKFDRRMQLAELDYIAKSIAAKTAFAKNFSGLLL